MTQPSSKVAGQPITLSFGREEYRDLIMLAYAGAWLINSTRVKDEAIQKFDQLEQKIYKVGLEHKFNDLVEYMREYEEIFPTKKLEESEMAGYIKEYDEKNLYEELISQLALRDFERQFPAAVIAKMPFEERLEYQDPFYDKYGEEFEAHGLDRLEIKEQ